MPMTLFPSTPSLRLKDGMLEVFTDSTVTGVRPRAGAWKKVSACERRQSGHPSRLSFCTHRCGNQIVKLGTARLWPS